MIEWVSDLFVGVKEEGVNKRNANKFNGPVYLKMKIYMVVRLIDHECIPKACNISFMAASPLQYFW